MATALQPKVSILPYSTVVLDIDSTFRNVEASGTDYTYMEKASDFTVCANNSCYFDSSGTMQLAHYFKTLTTSQLENSLKFRDNRLNNIPVYEVRLDNLTLPNIDISSVDTSGSGPNLIKDFPYFYVALRNETLGTVGNNFILTHNPYGRQAMFKMYPDKIFDRWVQYKSGIQNIVKMRIDQDLHFTVYNPYTGLPLILPSESPDDILQGGPLYQITAQFVFKQIE